MSHFEFQCTVIKNVEKLTLTLTFKKNINIFRHRDKNCRVSNFNFSLLKFDFFNIINVFYIKLWNH